MKPSSTRTVISNSPDSFTDYFRKLWKFKSLVLIFAMRDLKVKYAQTAIGLGWTLIQPLTSLIIFTFFFGYLLNWSAGDLPYALYILSGLIGWNFFAYVVNSGAASLQESSGLMKKVYFPKSVLPISKVLVSLVELLVTLVLLIPLMVYFKVSVSWQIVFLPVIIIYGAVCALTPVFWVAAFAFRKRDLFHLLPFAVYFGIWLTPVFFTVDLLPEKMLFLVNLNPIANVVELWRWVLFDYGEFKLIYALNGFLVVLLCVGGMYFFNRKENLFSEFA